MSGCIWGYSTQGRKSHQWGRLAVWDGDRYFPRCPRVLVLWKLEETRDDSKRCKRCQRLAAKEAGKNA